MPLCAYLTALAAVSLMLGGCGSLTSMDQVVYQPTVSRIGDVQISENSIQQFRLTGSDLDLVVGVLPEGNDGASEYVVHVLVIAEEKTEFGSVELGLALPTAVGSESGRTERDFVLHAARSAPRVSSGPMSKRGPSRTWMQKFRIEPDLVPGVHTDLLLSVSVEYKNQEGEGRQFDVIVPLAPTEITIPTSVV